MSDLEETASQESSREVVIKNKEKSQAIRENRMKNLSAAQAKRAQLKPVTEIRDKSNREVKTLEYLVKSKEAEAKVHLLKKRLAELDSAIEEAKKPLEKPVEVEKPKKIYKKNIIVEEPSTATDITTEENIIIKKKRGRKPKADKGEDESLNGRVSKKASNLSNLAFHDAIEKQRAKMLYNQLFGFS